MAEASTIEWTDATWNVVTGCSVVSPGCTNCYAMRLAGTRLKNIPSRIGLTKMTKAGPVWTGETRVNWEWIDQPLTWGRPRNIFVCAHGDLFQESVAWEDIATIYGVMIAAHHLRGHILQILTKRADRARELLSREDFWEVANAHASAEIMDRVDSLDRRSDDARAMCDDYGPDNPPPGLWLGTSVEDQVRADERIPHLLATSAAVRWLSCEPLLGGVDVRWALGHPLDIAEGFLRRGSFSPGLETLRALDWIVAGGESGRGARPMHPDWARSLRDQCAAAGVSFFFKHWGEWAPGENAPGPQTRTEMGASWFNDQWSFESITPRMGEELHCDDAPDVWRFGKKAAGRLLDGVEHNQMPGDAPARKFTTEEELSR